MPNLIALTKVASVIRIADTATTCGFVLYTLCVVSTRRFRQRATSVSVLPTAPSSSRDLYLQFPEGVLFSLQAEHAPLKLDLAAVSVLNLVTAILRSPGRSPGVS